MSREQYLYKAKLAEQAERYDEMVANMKLVAKLGTELSLEERNLLSVGFKNVVGARRASWRTISALKSKEEAKKGEHLDEINEYRLLIENELGVVCRDILTVLENYLIPAASLNESKVFFYKMKGDYNRYLAEFLTGDQKAECGKQALFAYQKATEIASAGLTTTHPLRLGLALNFSVFYYEIAANPTSACALAKQAFDDAISELDSLGEESYRESTVIMHLLRDNLSLWTSDIPKSEALIK